MCFGCLTPFLAPVIAWLGIPAPLLPSGPLRYVLGALALYRIVQMIGLDEGPFGIFLRIRDKIGVYDRGPNGQPIRRFARMIGCPHCLGMLFALPIAYIVLWPGMDGDLLLVLLGLAGAQALLQEFTHGAREGWG